MNLCLKKCLQQYLYVGFRFECTLENFFLFSNFTNQNVLKYLIEAFSAIKIFIFLSNPKALSKRKLTYVN